MVRNSLLLVSFALIFGLAGCNTTDSSLARQEPIYLRKGMSGEDVKSLIGEPLAVRNHPEVEGVAETWIYEESKDRLSQVQADTREVPYVHPVTGEEGYITEAVNKIKRDRYTLVTELFILNGELVGWKESTKQSTSWDD